MLDDKDIEKLGQGRIIKSTFYSSSGSNVAGPHYAVILDSDEDVKKHDSYFVAVISSNETIDSAFIMKVPAYTGLTGFVVGSWAEEAHLAGITEIGARFLPPDMVRILTLVHQASLAKGRKKTNS